MELQLQVPRNVEAEMAVLGSIILDETLVVEIMDELSPDDFYDSRNHIIFQAMVNLYTNGKGLDFTTLLSYLESNNMLEQCGGMDYLNSVVNYNYSTMNIDTYVELVREASLKRLTINSLSNLAQKGYDAKVNANDYLTSVEEVIFNLSKKRKIVCASRSLPQSFSPPCGQFRPFKWSFSSL